MDEPPKKARVTAQEARVTESRPRDHCATLSVHVGAMYVIGPPGTPQPAVRSCVVYARALQSGLDGRVYIDYTTDTEAVVAGISNLAAPPLFEVEKRSRSSTWWANVLCRNTAASWAGSLAASSWDATPELLTPREHRPQRRRVGSSPRARASRCWGSRTRGAYHSPSGTATSSTPRSCGPPPRTVTRLGPRGLPRDDVGAQRRRQCDYDSTHSLVGTRCWRCWRGRRLPPVRALPGSITGFPASSPRAGEERRRATSLRRSPCDRGLRTSDPTPIRFPAGDTLCTPTTTRSGRILVGHRPSGASAGAGVVPRAGVGREPRRRRDYSSTSSRGPQEVLDVQDEVGGWYLFRRSRARRAGCRARRSRPSVD